MGFTDRLAHAWNAFVNDKKVETTEAAYSSYGSSMGVRPSRPRTGIAGDKSIIRSIYTRLALDASSITMRHAKVNRDGRFISTMDSGLNNCLNVEANIDQAASAFRQDIFETLFEKGVIALVPIDVDMDPTMSGGFNIKTMRVGEIIDWYPQEVRVRVYNEKTGRREDLRLPKRVVAIVENPFYSVMNEPNSTLQRLIRKLNLLDALDEVAGSGKLDLIIQLPYTVKTETKRAEAEKRRTDIEMQLKGSTYGIAYADSTEKITQLNRPIENNMLKHVEYLTTQLFSQLGFTQSIFDGSADEKTMLNYHNRTIEPVVRPVVEAMIRTFITKTGRTQGQTILYFYDPFKFVPVSQIADIADKFARNEIATANEIRAVVGWMPSQDPKADALMNSNMPQPAEAQGGLPDTTEEDAIMEETFKELEAAADEIVGSADNG